MAKKQPFTVSRIKGLRYEGRRRGLGWLECDEDSIINAKAAYEKLKERVKGDVLNRFDYWQRGMRFDRYFHGWP